MKITIAGYGSVGSYVAGLFSDLGPTLYDPPLGSAPPATCVTPTS